MEKQGNLKNWRNYNENGKSWLLFCWPVLALSALTACSGSAGPLTKDNVTDYIIDYYKANGYQAEEEKSMESAAQAVLAYVNSQIGKSEYNGMALREAFSAIIEGADEDTERVDEQRHAEGRLFLLCQLCICE